MFVLCFKGYHHLGGKKCTTKGDLFHGEVMKAFRIKKKKKLERSKHQGIIMNDHESRLVSKNKAGPQVR